MTTMNERALNGDTSTSTRVLVGDSVYEDATLTLSDGRIYVEFDADDLDNVEIDAAVLARLLGDTQHGSREHARLYRNSPDDPTVYEVRDAGQHRGFIRVDENGIEVL
jgi:hypothetical protein